MYPGTVGIVGLLEIFVFQSAPTVALSAGRPAPVTADQVTLPPVIVILPVILSVVPFQDSPLDPDQDKANVPSLFIYVFHTPDA